MKTIHFFTVILLTTLFFCLTTSIQYEKNITDLKKISNSFYSENAVTFQGEIKKKKIVKDFIPKKSILYATIKSDKSIRAVYNNSYAGNPNIIIGRFFEDSDYNSNNRVAVVGKNIADINDTISINSNKFKVVGIMGYDTPSKLDDYTWINFNIDNVENEQILNYVIDGPNFTDNLSFTETEMWNDTAILPQMQENILYLTNTQNSTTFYSLAIITILLIITYILVIFIVQFKQNEIYVKKIHGYKNIWIIKDILIEFIFLIILSFIFSTFFLALFNNNNQFVTHLIYSIIVTCIVSILLTFLIYSEVTFYEKKYKKI
ncbi:ABC transporter permease [Vagococcus fluvialis]|uniref:ABC transporter permease n=1 Tax=Vagococcus fluvialis TaxID=2738 RepID=UPI001D0AF9A1|nr:ABC transporter permease [Vagococcus fluvialis]UDM81173.1 ABC transporter permease [Vagococcus fluvialis]